MDIAQNHDLKVSIKSNLIETSFKTMAFSFVPTILCLVFCMNENIDVVNDNVYQKFLEVFYKFDEQNNYFGNNFSQFVDLVVVVSS